MNTDDDANARVISSQLLSAEASADQVIELVEQVPAPTRAPVGDDAKEVIRLVREKSDAELDVVRSQLIGLG